MNSRRSRRHSLGFTECNGLVGTWDTAYGTVTRDAAQGIWPQPAEPFTHPHTPELIPSLGATSWFNISTEWTCGRVASALMCI